MKIFKSICLTLIIIGAINWGLIGFFDFNLVTAIFSSDNSVIAKIIYILIGIAGLLSIRTLVDLLSDEK